MGKGNGGTRTQSSSSYVVYGIARTSSEVDSFLKQYSNAISDIKSFATEENLSDGSDIDKQAWKEVTYHLHNLDRYPAIDPKKLSTSDEALEIANKLSNITTSIGTVKVGYFEAADDVMSSKKRILKKAHERAVNLSAARMMNEIQKKSRDIHKMYFNFVKNKKTE